MGLVVDAAGSSSQKMQYKDGIHAVVRVKSSCTNMLMRPLFGMTSTGRGSTASLGFRSLD
jgi:hypothetical protein